MSGIQLHARETACMGKAPCLFLSWDGFQVPRVHLCSYLCFLLICPLLISPVTAVLSLVGSSRTNKCMLLYLSAGGVDASIQGTSVFLPSKSRHFRAQIQFLISQHPSKEVSFFFNLPTPIQEEVVWLPTHSVPTKAAWQVQLEQFEIDFFIIIKLSAEKQCRLPGFYLEGVWFPTHQAWGLSWGQMLNNSAACHHPSCQHSQIRFKVTGICVQEHENTV